MIGGSDIIFPAVSDSASLEACARIVRKRWPNARFEDAVTGDKYPCLADVPFGAIGELLVYPSQEAEDSWDEDSPDSPENSMLYFISRDDEVTVVLDNPDTADMRFILDLIRGALMSYVEDTNYTRAA